MMRTVAGGNGDPDHEWLPQFNSGRFIGRPQTLTTVTLLMQLELQAISRSAQGEVFKESLGYIISSTSTMHVVNIS